MPRAVHAALGLAAGLAALRAAAPDLLMPAVAVLAAVAAAAALRALAVFARSPLHRMPGPRSPSLLFGQLLEIIRRPPAEPQAEWAAEHGGMVCYRTLGTKLKVLATDPAAVRRVFVDNMANYEKPKELFFFRRIVGDSLLTKEGRRHAVHRRHLGVAFRHASLRAWADTFTRQAAALAARWDAALDGGGGGGEHHVDMRVEAAKLTLDNVGLTVFEHDFGALRDREDRLGSAYATILGAAQLSLPNLVSMALGVPTPAVRRANRAIETTRSVALELIAAARKRREATGHAGSGIISLLLDARDDEGRAVFDDEGVRDETLGLLLAGHETTAGTLCWALYLLAQHPEAADRAAAEARAAAAAARADGRDALGWDDMKRLPFVEAVVRETLRLYPAAAILSREAQRDDVLAGYQVPAGTVVFLSPWVQGRLASLWGDDAASFRPARFLDDACARRLPAAAWTPFLLGQHQCIGQRFALAELVLTLAHLLPRFRVALGPGADKVRPKLRVTLQPSPSMPLVVSRRAEE